MIGFCRSVAHRSPAPIVTMAELHPCKLDKRVSLYNVPIAKKAGDTAV